MLIMIPRLLLGLSLLSYMLTGVYTDVIATFSNAPGAQRFKVNTDALIQCEVEGDPTPGKTYVYEGYKLNSGSKYNIQENGLLVKNIQARDAGVYTCNMTQVQDGKTQYYLRYINVKVIIMECDFNIDFCGFDDNKMPGVAHWRRHTGSTPTLRTGPSGDLSHSGGYYIYLESDDVKPNGEVVLRSPELAENVRREKIDIEFNYNMYGATMGSLVIYGVLPDESRERIWSTQGNLLQDWRKKELCGLTLQQYRYIEFVGKRGEGLESDAAVDNILIMTTRPLIAEPVPTTTSTKAVPTTKPTPSVSDPNVSSTSVAIERNTTAKPTSPSTSGASLHLCGKYTSLAVAGTLALLLSAQYSVRLR
ncbi:unnamed protein product [Owenia fusiformis]|uniref:Uncharacterized protein n=1 Tax=Owenia fusiformis TaxID=6347 RepID=A0A8J1XV07_OWEFU|nr:unnamed protein product [Owenia fusiformis]